VDKNFNISSKNELIVPLYGLFTHKQDHNVPYVIQSLFTDEVIRYQLLYAYWIDRRSMHMHYGTSNL